MTSSTPPLKFVAQVEPVKEVTLHGHADLAYWQNRLRGEELQPASCDGSAQLFVSATEAKFLGLTFRECIIGIQVAREHETEAAAGAMYLLHAWNSLRAFAWIERNLFSTPYYPGQIRVAAQAPATFQINERGVTLIDAAIGGTAPPTKIAEETWQGPIFLPRKNGGPQKLFVARLEGRTEHFPFVPAADQFTLTPSDSCAVIRELVESQFTPYAWHVRQAAAHAKSKTYRVADYFRM
ncbi:hypothetical protein NA78x_001641 [Anatilimnocola sp. NA78]|uniref:hypothetical protein n=1 Tax=Anatilimnocola sp. NA78 TaxID=3415683 RepID=UPI003CE491EF